MFFHKSFQNADLVIKKHCEIFIYLKYIYIAYNFAYIVIHLSTYMYTYYFHSEVEEGFPHSKTILQETVKTAQTNF